MKFEPDEIDSRIMDILSGNGRISNRQIAGLLGVGESTVRKRIRRLESLKVMQLAVVCDPGALGIRSMAFLRASVIPEHTARLAEWLTSLDETSFVASSIGGYNMIALFTATDKARLAETVLGPLSNMAGVTAFEVREIIDVSKHRWDLVRIP